MYITEKGYAFVTMADDDGADQAIRELNGTVIDGQEIKVDNARGGGGGGGRGKIKRFNHKFIHKFIANKNSYYLIIIFQVAVVAEEDSVVAALDVVVEVVMVSKLKLVFLTLIDLCLRGLTVSDYYPPFHFKNVIFRLLYIQILVLVFGFIGY